MTTSAKPGVDAATLDRRAVASTRVRIVQLSRADRHRATANAAWNVGTLIAHRWDRAVATGQDRALDPELCRAEIAIIERFPAAVWGDPRFYAEPKHTASADRVDRLVALTGRDPSAAL